MFLASCSGSKDEPEGNSIRVMAYNIHHANPPSKPDSIDIDAIVEVLKAHDADLVSLQEVDVNVSRSGSIDQAELIASKLEMKVFFGKAIDHQGGDYGVAVLSKYPLSEEVVHRLPTKPETSGEPRVMATAKVKLPDGTPIRFGSTHLDAQEEAVNRELQINKIVEIASEEKLPFILAGDFNATPDSEVIRVLDSRFTRTCTQCPPTIPVDTPEKAIDFIAYEHPENKFTVESHRVIDEKYASDHLPVIAVINY